MENKIIQKGHLFTFFNAMKENTTWVDGVDEIVDDAVEAAIRNRCGDNKVYILTNGVYNNNIIVCSPLSIDHNVFTQIAENAKAHCFGDELHGASHKGSGRTFAQGILCEIGEGSESVYEMFASINGTNKVKVMQRRFRTESDLSTFTIKEFDNNNIDGLIGSYPNIINGKLQGVIVRVMNCVNSFDFGNKFIKNHFSGRYCEPLLENTVNIFINGEKLDPIDFCHDHGFNTHNDMPIVHTEGGFKFITMVHELDVLNPDTGESIGKLLLKGTTSTVAKTKLKEKFPWETDYGFNALGGVYLDLNGFKVVLGGNAQTMFHQNIETGDTKGKAKYGDISGGFSGYNRLTIKPLSTKLRDVFGISTIKSNSLKGLSDNLDLCKYIALPPCGYEAIPLYDYICNFRKFLDSTYTEFYKGEKSLDYFSEAEVQEKLNCFFDRYNIKDGRFKLQRKTKKEKKIDTILGINSVQKKCEIHSMEDEQSLVHAKWNDKLDVLELNLNKSIWDRYDFSYFKEIDNAEEKISKIIINDFKKALIVMVKYKKLFDIRYITSHFVALTRYHREEQSGLLFGLPQMK